MFRHLHALSLRFHLNRQTGGMTRDIERGTRGHRRRWCSYTLFSILPTLVEIALVLGIPGAALRHLVFGDHRWSRWSAYITFTVIVTDWRTHFRRTMNELDSKANTRAIDSLINYETVKYFGNEDYEARALRRAACSAMRRRRCKSQTSLSLLNTGQSLIIAIARHADPVARHARRDRRHA